LQSQQHDILQSQKHFTTTINNNPQFFLKKTHFTHNNQKTTMTLESQQQQQGVCHIVALPFTFKKYLKARIMETQIFHHAKYHLQKIL
jgi:hypothetical protein